MTAKITLQSPVDMHAHLRQGAMLDKIVPLTTPTWSGVLAMPNTSPPITTEEQLINYRADILKSGNVDENDFKPFLALYFQTNYTRDFLEKIRKHILSVKFYPKNLTTNSQHGCDPNDPEVLTVLKHLEALEIPLNVHAEAEGYYHDRESLFALYIDRWVSACPKLKIILEHMSDRANICLLAYPNVYATVTPQHLLTTGNDWFGPPFNPHLYCMPCVKRKEDRDELLHAATEKFAGKFMAGTDSAPHSEDAKVQCGCAGVFTAPIALQLYAQAFESVGRLDQLQAFVSDNARRIYDINPPDKTITLIREPFNIPSKYSDVIPMWAEKTIDWSIHHE